MTTEEFLKLGLDASREGKFPALTECGVGCMYLTRDGRKCWVGLCIPDGHPAQKSSDYVGGVVLSHPDLTAHLPPHLECNWGAAQACHDVEAKLSRKEGRAWSHANFVQQVRETFPEYDSFISEVEGAAKLDTASDVAPTQPQEAP